MQSIGSRRPLLAGVGGAAMLWAISGPAFAQDAQTSAPSQAGAAVSEVVVTGKFAQKPAAVLQLQSDNTVTVLTAKDLTTTPDENIASSLSRVPGVTALPGGFPNTNGVGADEPGRGEANYVALRGMDAEFNINTINGVNAAQGQPYSREVQLALLPPTGLQTIVVNKTLTPAMDGDAIGGAIDYRTPSAFDFIGKEAFSLQIGAQANSRSIDYGTDPLGGEVAVSAARKFGDHDQLGVYVSAYYDVRDFSNSIVDGIYPAATNGMWAFSQQTASGASALADQAHNLTLEGLNLGYTTGQEERWGGSLSVDWRASDTFSAYMRITYAHQSVIQDSYYSQVYGADISTVPLGNGLSGVNIGQVQPRFYYETSPEEALLATYQVGTEMRFGRLHLSPNLYASWGDNDEPDHFEFSARQPEFLPGDAFTLNQPTLVGYGGLYPHLLLPASELANIANIGSYGARRAGEVTNEFAGQTKLGAKIDAAYDFDLGWLKDIQFGAKFENSNRWHNVRDFTSDTLGTTNANDPSFASLGVFNGSVKAIVPGQFNFSIPTISNSKAFALFQHNLATDFGGSLAATSDECGGTVSDSINCDTQHGVEQVSAAYVMADLRLGPVQVIPGLRFEHTDIRNTFYDLPDTGGGSFQSDSTHYNKVLPSISANWRPNPLSVYRAAVWTGYVAPSMFQLGGGEQVSVSDDGSKSITQGNPNLKTIDAVNYDLSGEWLNTHGGSASVALFYKSLDHFIFDTINGFTNASSATQGFTTITKPVNGGTGHVEGLELAGRQKFVDLPAPFDGFGVQGNVTLEHSGVHTELAGLDSTERLLNQPDLSANFQLFYEAHAFDAQLSYRYVGPYVSQYGTLKEVSALDTWVQENQRWDIHVGYMTPWHVHVDASVANLLDQTSYYATIGRHSDVIPTIVDSGRTYHLTARYAF